MQTIETSNIDKSEWGSGHWQLEPDKVQWLDEATGLPCLAVRNPSGGHWCGYVGVTEGHPYFEKKYDDAGADVHGGLTYSDFCQPDPPTGHNAVCHVVEAGENDRVWWLGFDCAHCYDLSPAHAARDLRRGYYPMSHKDVYRTLEYVKSECRSLAKQLKDLATGGA